MKTHNSRLLFSFLLTLFLTGCSILGTTANSEEQCVCCTEGLLESEPIQDLIDADNKWMGMELWVTKAKEIEAIFEDMPHEFCYWKRDNDGSHKICGDIPETYFETIEGYIYVYLPEYGCEVFRINWEMEKIDRILFSCPECITVGQLFSQIGEPHYLSAWRTGLHESELATTLFYPERGLSVDLDTLDPLNPLLTGTSTIGSLSLTLSRPDDWETTFREMITGTDYQCLRVWHGYGDIAKLHYSGKSDGTCPYGGD